MEALSRQEYPAMLASLQPAQAISALNERVRRVGRVNTEIADWLSERRKVEEAYVQGLKKLSHKQPPDSQSELGIFTTPWQKIVAATESIAQSHHTFATRIEQDVELPLRSFASKDREMQAMSTIQGNLGAIAKELDEAQKSADKLGKKGKTSSSKLDSATQKLEQAFSQWDSQAPFVFEKLQAVDESRLNHLRDVLTQYQTHEADQVERCRVTAENTLNAMLEVETSLEIQNFSRNITQGKPKLERNPRRTSSSTGSNTLPPPAPATRTEDDATQNSVRNEGPSESKGGLKRLGTMLGRRRQSVHGSFVRAPSPSKGYSPFGRAPGSRDGRPTPSPRASSHNLRETPSRDNRLSSLVESPTSPVNVRSLSQPDRLQQRDTTNGEFTGFTTGSLLNPDAATAKPSSIDNVNGTTSKEALEISDAQPPPGPSTSQLKENRPATTERDSEGFTVPAAPNDPISLAQQEAANEFDQPQFKLDIKKEPIREEDADAQAALSNVANTLRSSTLVTPSRKTGTVRGRRDVRNTMYIPGPDPSDSRSLENNIPPSPGIVSGMTHGAHRAAALATLSTEQSNLSDTQSIRSARSLASNSAIKHPEMHLPGLNSSIVETVSASFENGEIKTCAVVGEVAFVYGQSNSSSPSPYSGTEIIRLKNFSNLEAIAPNHVFVNELSAEKPGEYTINLSHLSKTAIAFRYKVHVDSSNLVSHVPLILKPAWRPQGDKLGVIIEYALNPAFATANNTRSVILNNFVLIATYEGAKAAGCQTKPTGTHLKDKSLIYWRLGDVTLTQDNTMQKVIGRLIGAEGGEPKPGIVEARWEISTPPGQVLGSGLGISRLDVTGEGKAKEKSDGTESSDPFADDLIANKVAAVLAGHPPPGLGDGADSEGTWVDLQSSRKILSGKYDARHVVDESAIAGSEVTATAVATAL